MDVTVLNKEIEGRMQVKFQKIRDDHWVCILHTLEESIG